MDTDMLRDVVTDTSQVWDSMLNPMASYVYGADL
jgi:hypothetical protein